MSMGSHLLDLKAERGSSPRLSMIIKIVVNNCLQESIRFVLRKHSGRSRKFSWNAIMGKYERNDAANRGLLFGSQRRWWVSLQAEPSELSVSVEEPRGCDDKFKPRCRTIRALARAIRDPEFAARLQFAILSCEPLRLHRLPARRSPFAIASSDAPSHTNGSSGAADFGKPSYGIDLRMIREHVRRNKDTETAMMNGRELSQKETRWQARSWREKERWPEKDAAGSNSDFPGAQKRAVERRYAAGSNSDFPGVQKAGYGDAAGSNSDFPGAQTGGWQREKNWNSEGVQLTVAAASGTRYRRSLGVKKKVEAHREV
ncbi:hypothetical protein DFH11DRAFT_1743342 [Phellopilus nigrolimitatus]|nr:hypothetical protein DFH11DRAFT_1743342 [Phellopilus nigrolimitatus]